MSEMLFCQSCGMPLQTDDMRGTNADGGKSDDYCSFCYKNGVFTQDISMEEMIELNLQYIDEWNKNSEKKMTVEEVKAQLETFMPTLKRWSK